MRTQAIREHGAMCADCALRFGGIRSTSSVIHPKTVDKWYIKRSTYIQ